MRPWLSALFLLIAFLSGVRAQISFPDGAPVRFSYRERIKDLVFKDPASADPEAPDYIVATERTIVIEGTAPLTDYDLSDIDENTLYSINVGDFSSNAISGLVGRLSDDELFDPLTDRSVNIPINALTLEGEEVVGAIKLSWNANTVTFSVSVTNSNQPLTVIDQALSADFYREKNEEIDAEDLTAAFSFGPFRFDLRTVYTTGTAAFQYDSLNRVADPLSDVSLFGAIDYLPPAVAFVNPSANNLKWSLPQYTITGTVSDKREIPRGSIASTLSFVSGISSVEVQVGTRTQEGTFVEAEVDGNNWVLANVNLEPGDNFITVRATDEHGNVTTIGPRKMTFSQTGPITVEAIAKDFADGNGQPAGTAAGAFFSGNPKKITALIGQPKASNKRDGVETGQLYSVKATPSPGAVFNGWTATLNGLPYFTAVNEQLVFETKPNLVLTADFVPNPFAPVYGTYLGLVDGDEAKERGAFKIAVNKNGAFTGKAQIGPVTLPLRGKVLGSGRWEQTITKQGKSYTVTFVMDLTEAGDRRLTGSIVGSGVESEIVADLKNWRKPKGEDPGRLATEYAGTYNVHIKAPALPTSGVPEGIGYGRVTISPLGLVSFAGQLGDGTRVTTASVLAKRASGPVVFPLFIALDKKYGNISGFITLASQPNSDLSGNLTWQEPQSGKVEPQAFKDTVTLAGSRYTKPETGAFAMLADPSINGSGAVTLKLRAYSVPVEPIGSDIEIDAPATLSATTNLITLTDPVQASALAFKMKVSPSTGLFSGSYRDPQLNRVIPFSGIIDQKADSGHGIAAGVLVRGNRAGSILFERSGPM